MIVHDRPFQHCSDTSDTCEGRCMSRQMSCDLGGLGSRRVSCMLDIRADWHGLASCSQAAKQPPPTHFFCLCVVTTFGGTDGRKADALALIPGEVDADADGCLLFFADPILMLCFTPDTTVVLSSKALFFLFLLCFLPMTWSMYWFGPFNHISQSRHQTCPCVVSSPSWRVSPSSGAKSGRFPPACSPKNFPSRCFGA